MAKVQKNVRLDELTLTYLERLKIMIPEYNDHFTEHDMTDGKVIALAILELYKTHLGYEA